MQSLVAIARSVSLVEPGRSRGRGGAGVGLCYGRSRGRGGAGGGGGAGGRGGGFLLFVLGGRGGPGPRRSRSGLASRPTGPASLLRSRPPTARPAAGRDPTDLTHATAGRRAGGSGGGGGA